MWELLLGGGVAVALIEVVKEIILRILEARGKHKTCADKKIDVLESAIRALLRERIRYLCRVHIAAGEISYSDREDIILMHDAYHGLGGNGNLDVEMDAILKLKRV